MLTQEYLQEKILKSAEVRRIVRAIGHAPNIRLLGKGDGTGRRLDGYQLHVIHLEVCKELISHLGRGLRPGGLLFVSEGVTDASQDDSDDN